MERQLAQLALRLRRCGHEVTVIARTCELPADAGVVFRRVRGPSRPFLLAYPWFMLAGSLAVWRWRRGIVQVTGAIVLNHVDVIAVHCCHQVFRAKPSRLTTAFRLYIGVVGPIKRIAERVCFRVNRSAAVVCVSDGVADEVREHYPWIARRVRTIHNGVDTQAFAPGARPGEALAMRANLGIPEGRLVLAFVGGEWGHKGLRPVIQALAQAPDWDLVVAGHGDQPRYQELADSAGVGGAVHWLGLVRDVQIVYTLADAFVLPSSYEAFPLVTLEAAASALPVLATPVNGVRELIEDGQSGFIISAEPSAIAARLTELAESPALRARLGNAARESALRFGLDEMSSAHQELFRELGAARAT
jgi:glycosyltransferase involved in cell wall biosynthesis